MNKKINDLKDPNRRKFFMVIGVAATTYAKPSQADPIKLIVEAMAQAAKMALDAAIQQIQDMMQNIMNGAFEGDTKKVAQVGDGINATKVEIYNQKVLRSSMPAPRGCDVKDEADNKRLSERTASELYAESKQTRIGRVLNDNRSYAAGIRDQLRELGIAKESVEASSSGEIMLSPSSIFKDISKALSRKEESAYTATVDAMLSTNKLPNTLPVGEGQSANLLRKKYLKKANSKSIALAVYEIDLSDLKSGLFKNHFDSVDKTYSNKSWRTGIHELADPVPLGISLYNEKVTQLELLMELVRLKEQALVLRLIKTMQVINEHK